MWSDPHRHIVGGVVPGEFVGHRVVDGAAIHFEAFKGDVAHTALVIVTGNERELGFCASVADVAQVDVLQTAPSSEAWLYESWPTTLESAGHAAASWL